MCGFRLLAVGTVCVIGDSGRGLGDWRCLCGICTPYESLGLGGCVVCFAILLLCMYGLAVYDC